jgi:O-antigen/teichoic acid export membrane protein
VNIVVAPRFAALYAQGNRQGLQQLVATVAHWIFWPSLAIAIALIAFATPVLQLFGSEFATARWELSVLAIGQLVNTSVGSVGYLMMMTGHQDRAAAVFGIAALANLVLNAIAVPLFGTIGAAVATALTLAWWNLWLYRLVVRYLDVYPSVVSTWLRRGRSS